MGVFGLSIITLGIYPVYWMYTRAKRINSLHDNKISSVLLISLIVAAFHYSSIFFGQSEAAIIASGSIGTVYFALDLTVLFEIRNRLQDITDQPDASGYKINLVLTFFFICDLSTIQDQ